MKTPKSILDHFFKTAARLMKSMGKSVSALFPKAESAFGDENGVLGVRERLDAVYGADPESSRIDPLFARLQIESLPEDDW